MYKPDMTKVKMPVKNPGTQRQALLIFCLSLFGLLESHFFSSVRSDEIWVVSVQYLPAMNHNYSQDCFHSHKTAK